MILILKSAQARCEGPIEDEVELFDWLKMVVVNCVGEIMENSPRGSGFARTGPLVSISGYLEVDVQIGGQSRKRKRPVERSRMIEKLYGPSKEQPKGPTRAHHC